MKMTLQSLAKLIHERFKIDPSRVVAEATLDDLGFDSLSQIDLAILVERNTGIRIGDDKLNEISRISDILAVANGSA
jgi:acyl carrier protein